MMRALARTNPAQLPATGPATILRVIDAPADAEVPVTLTQWDLSFLRGLYASPANLRAPAQRGAIGNTIARDLHRAETGGGTEHRSSAFRFPAAARARAGRTWKAPRHRQDEGR